MRSLKPTLVGPKTGIRMIDITRRVKKMRTVRIQKLLFELLCCFNELSSRLWDMNNSLLSWYYEMAARLYYGNFLGMLFALVLETSSLGNEEGNRR
jgi:hypothetical protein